MKKSTFHNIMTMLVGIFVVLAGGSTSLAWCLPADACVDGHFVIENTASVSHNNHKTHEHSGFDANVSEIAIDCHDCVHIPVTVETNYTRSVAQSMLSPFSLCPPQSSFSSSDLILSSPGVLSLALRSSDFISLPDTQLAVLRTYVLLI